MKVFKPLAKTQVSDSLFEYSNGYDVITVLIDRAETDDRHDGKIVCLVTWPGVSNSGIEKLAIEMNALEQRITEYLNGPRPQKFTLAEFEATGKLHGVARVSLSDISDYHAYNVGLNTLMHEIIDFKGAGTAGKRVTNYEIVGFEGRDAFIMIEVEKHEDEF